MFHLVQRDLFVGSALKTLNPLLRMAVLAGVETSVKLHIRRGDDVNARDSAGATPLMIAASRKKKGVLRLLLSAGADPTILDTDGRDALIYAERGGCPECVEILRSALAESKEKMTSLLEVPAADPKSLRGATPADAESVSSIKAQPTGSRQSEPVVASKGPDYSTAVKVVTNQDILNVSQDTFEDCEDFDLGDWESEVEQEAPEGNSAVVEQVREIHEAIRSHKPIDMDQEWSDVEAFLPARTHPVAVEVADGGDLRLFLLRVIREGAVPEEALVNVCYTVDGSRNEESERLLAFVAGDLGAIFDERFEAEDSPYFPEANISEEHEIAEAVAYIEDLASGRNDPLRYYVRAFRAPLLGADEEIALSREFEETGDEALSILSSWPHGLSAIREAAAKVTRGEADIESFSSGPEPTEDGCGDLIDDEADDAAPPDHAAAFAVAVDRISDLNDPADIKGMLVALGLSRGFLLELADSVGSDPIGKSFVSAIRRQAAAREKMILSNLRLAYSIAKNYVRSGEPIDDLVQEGNIGLMKAVERFDWRKGFRFSTYATWWIRQQITRAIADKSRTVRMPVHLWETIRKLIREREEFEATHGRPETPEEISERTGIPPSRVRNMLVMAEDVLSLDDEVDIDGEPLTDTIPDPMSRDPSDFVEYASLRATLQKMLEDLDARSAEVISLRFGLNDDDPMTLEEIGQRLDVTRERVRQIESKALRKLAHPTRKEILAVYMGERYADNSERGLLAQSSADGSNAPSQDARRMEIPRDDARMKDSEVSETRSIQTTIFPRSGSRTSPSVHDKTLAEKPKVGLDKLLYDARELGMTVDDNRVSGGQVCVMVPATMDSKGRSLVRKMFQFGFRNVAGRRFCI